MASKYKIACVNCSQVAVVRTQLDIAARLIMLGHQRTGAQKHLIDDDGFAACEDDSIFFTVCWPCEKRNALQHRLPLELGQPGGKAHARLASPYLSRSLVESWPLLRKLDNIRLGPSQDARPIIKIELLSRIVKWNKYPGKYEVRNIVYFRDLTNRNGVTHLPDAYIAQFLSPEEPVDPEE